MRSRVVYSPGRITALWLVLRTIAKLAHPAATTEVIAFASRSSLRSGGLPVKDGYRLAVIGGFVRQHGNDSNLTDLGLTALGLCGEDEPNGEVRRLLVSTIMLRRPPAWVAYWQGDPSSLDLVIPPGDRDSLQSAGLLPADTGDLRRRAWWLALGAVPLPDQMQGLRKAIGDAGEELSFRYEKARLTSQGFPELADAVTWVARESPAYGFDVASFVGSSTPSRDADRPLNSRP